MEKRGAKVFELSGATGEGAQAVLDACARVLFATAEKKVRLKARHVTEEVITANEALAKPKKTQAPKPAAKKPVAKKPPTKPAGKKATKRKK